MYVLAIHRISDAQKFWEVLGGAGPLPPGIAVHQTLPDASGTTAVCLWEADSVETVRGLVESTVGEYSENEFLAIDEATARGLPGR